MTATIRAVCMTTPFLEDGLVRKSHSKCGIHMHEEHAVAFNLKQSGQSIYSLVVSFKGMPQNALTCIYVI